MTHLRLIEEDDIPDVVEMGADMVAVSSFAPIGYDPEKVAEFVRRCRKDGFAIVSVSDGEITGLFLGDIVVPWYGVHRMAVDHVLYVRPEFQGTRAALMLVKAWMRWARLEGATQIRPGTAATCEAADRLYTSLGFERAGAVYVMNRS